MDVRAWLEDLELRQYADAFAANHVDLSVLRTLTADDLRELGVSSLGHRKRLLEAIGSLAAEAPNPTAGADTERRQVAVLFADLCGFTELSAELGAEQIHRIVERLLDRVDGIVAEHGGTVDKHIGDATMALFGAPVAHEDDPFRAIGAADALQRAMPALSVELGRPPGRPLAVHVGIALGEVVAGEIGGNVRRDYTVLGDTVNLAARLVAEAGIGETVLSDAAWRAVAGRARGVFLGERKLKGITRPQRLWRLEGLQEDGAVLRLPFVGRDVEFAQAVAVLAAARPGAVLHLRGEAGIGKTRLLTETIAEAERRGFAAILLRNLDFGAARRQNPLRSLADALAKRHPAWPLDRVLEDGARAALHDVLEQPMPPELAVPYAAMEDARRTILRAVSVAALATAVATTVPVIVAVEDLHWAGEATAQLVRALARRTPHARLVLLTTSRPEGDPIDAAFRRESTGATVATIELGPLSGEATRKLAEAASNAIDGTIIERFVARSGGNPLFVEQLALSAVDPDTTPVPGSIRGLVQARLDRLRRGDRSALQAASVLGQRFAPAALGALLGETAFNPRPLIDAGLLVHDDGQLMFAHALIQEATYASLLGETARRLHRRAADWFADGEPDLHAQHLDRAGDPGAPAAYRLACERLRDSGRFALALQRGERGLELARDDADIVALAWLAGHLRLDLGAPREALAHFRVSLERAGGDNGKGEAEYGIAAALRITDDLVGANEALDRARKAAERGDLTALGSRCHHLRGNLLFPLGRVEECMAEHRVALALAERAQSPELIARALGGLADAHYAQGRMRSARKALERCIAAARAAGAGAVEIANRPMAALAECYMLDLQTMRELAETARQLAVRAQNRRAELISLHGLMIAAAESEEPELGLPHFETAHAIVIELGAWRFEGENVIFAAQLESQAGHRTRAAEMARQAVALCRSHAMAYLGAVAFGIGCSITDDAAERDAWLGEGEKLVSVPTLGHNHLFFRRYAIEASLQAGRPEEARRHARALSDYASGEPMPFTDLVVRRGLLLADAADGRLTPQGRADLNETLERARRAGFVSLAREAGSA